MSAIVLMYCNTLPLTSMVIQNYKKHLKIEEKENNVSNLPEQACKYLIQDIGKCNSKTLCLYYDRRHLYGLKHFDMQKVNSSMESKSALTKKIIKRAYYFRKT